MKKKALVFLSILSLVFIFSGTVNVKAEKVENKNTSLIIKNNVDDSGQLVFPENGKNELVLNQEDRFQSAPYRILVKYKKQEEVWIQEAKKAAMETAYGIEEIKRFSFIDVYLYKTYWNKEKTLEDLIKNPNIEYAEPDYIVYADSTVPNDPYFDNLWGLHNVGQTGGTEDADIDAPGAWDLTTGTSNVIVAVIDTGVDYNHEDLSANMWTNSGETPDNGIDDDGNGYVDDYYGINAITDIGDPLDDNGHGTHCSGSIAAVGNNGIGVTGVCWTAKIMALKFLDSEGSGWSSDAIKCIEYAIDKQAHVTSNSWGGGGFSQALKDAINAAKDANILFIAAAGNSGTNNDEHPHYPSSQDCDNIIAVAATTNTDTNQYYNYGPNSVDVAAPGIKIYSTMPDNSYGYLSGTSMATPHVAGLAALILAYFSSSNEVQVSSTLTWEQVKNRILSGVDQLASLQGRVLTGGRINAHKSLISGEVTSYLFDIKSSPSTEAYIEVTPNDLNGQGDGYTNFARIYAPYTDVTLTAPETHSGRKFGLWTLEGTRYSFERSISFKMDFNHIAEAVYPQWTLEVESSPETNILINVNPLDENDEGDGYTNFTRKYQHGTTVSLTVPAEHSGKKFITWHKNGEAYDTNPTTTIDIDNDYTLTAYYSDKLMWRYNTGSALVNYSSPAIGSDGEIYFGAGTNLYAINPDGTEKWKFQANSIIYTSPAIGSDGIIYFLSQNTLYALNPNGIEKWKCYLEYRFLRSSPAISSDGTIYCGNTQKYLYAVDKSGILKWKFQAGDYIYSSPAIGPDGTIYFSCTDGKIYALNPDGTKKWEFTSPISNEWTVAPPAIGSDGTIYVGGWRIIFYAINPDGTLKWIFPPWRSLTTLDLEKTEGPSGGFGSMWGSTAILSQGINDIIYIPTYTGVYAVNQDGTEKWYFRIGSGGEDWVFSSPAIDTNGTIYFGAENCKFYAVNSDGTSKWEFITGGKIYLSSAAMSTTGTIYFCSEDGYLYALNTDSQGLNNSVWPKFQRDNNNTGRIPSSFDLRPRVSITSPSDGDTIFGTVNVEATASDDEQVVKVEFYIDDELKSTDTTSPYAYSWDTTAYTNGTHKVKAIAYDNIGQKGEHEISVTVTNYSLSIATGTGGATDPEPGTYTYDPGTEVSITATPDTGYRFSGWSGDVPSGHENDNPITITMDSDKSVTANFIARYTLTIAVGTGGTTDPSPGSYTYDSGTEVTIKSTPNSGYRFSGWSGDVPSGHENDNPITITMDSDISITANFIQQYTLTIATGTGGTTDPPPGSYSYDSETEVTINAAPDSGYRFSGWSGDVPSGHENDNPITITMDSDKSITANFIGQYTLTIVAGTGGTTSPSPGSYDYDSGTQVSVTATASTGYDFSGWSGAASGTATTITINMDSDKSITASFTAISTGDGDGGETGKKGCFIATAAYDSALHPYVETLRDFRERYLMPNKLGRVLINFYYKYSPLVADLIAKHKVLKIAVGINLLPLVAFSYSMLHFGPIITVITLVFIFTLPIFLVSFFRRKLSRLEPTSSKALASRDLKKTAERISAL